MNWYKKSKTNLDLEDELNHLLQSLRDKYPLSKLEAWLPQNHHLELANIEVKPEMRGQGIGHAVIKQIQDFARKHELAITLRPEPKPGKKLALERFYRSLGFQHNKGRTTDYELSSPFASTMYWKPNNKTKL